MENIYLEPATDALLHQLYKGFQRVLEKVGFRKTLSDDMLVYCQIDKAEQKNRGGTMTEILWGIFYIAAFGALAYAITHEIKKGEQERDDKWADYERRKRNKR